MVEGWLVQVWYAECCCYVELSPLDGLVVSTFPCCSTTSLTVLGQATNFTADLLDLIGNCQNIYVVIRRCAKLANRGVRVVGNGECAHQQR